MKLAVISFTERGSRLNILDAGTVRVTFDMNVRAAVGGFDIFDSTLPVLPVLEPGKLVMEVK